MHRVIFVGSARAHGRSAALADAIFEACIEDFPQDGVSVVSVAGMQIAGCTGCNACRGARLYPAKNNPGHGIEKKACEGGVAGADAGDAGAGAGAGADAGAGVGDAGVAMAAAGDANVPGGFVFDENATQSAGAAWGIGVADNLAAADATAGADASAGTGATSTADVAGGDIATPPSPSPAFDPNDPLAPCKFVRESDAAAHVCVIEDDMAEVRRHLDAADELFVVCPVYFGGAPAQAKAALDRLQPYFYSDIRAVTRARRPMTVHVVGECAGGDPYGADALIATLRSAFGVAGFRIERLLDWTGCQDETGEILADAREVDLSTLKIHPVPLQGEGARPACPAAAAGGERVDAAADAAADTRAAAAADARAAADAGERVDAAADTRAAVDAAADARAARFADDSAIAAGSTCACDHADTQENPAHAAADARAAADAGERVAAARAAAAADARITAARAAGAAGTRPKLSLRAGRTGSPSPSPSPSKKTKKKGRK